MGRYDGGGDTMMMMIMGMMMVNLIIDDDGFMMIDIGGNGCNDYHDNDCDDDAIMVHVISGVMSQKIWGAQSLRGSVATERREGVGGGCPPSHARELFQFST